MKALILFFIIIAFVFNNVACFFDKTDHNELLVGYSKENISPVTEDGEIIPAPLGGYAGVRLTDDIESDIYAICTAFRDTDSETALVYSIDNTGINEELSNELIKAISESVGVPENNIILNCMHNHSSPTLGSDIDASYTYRKLIEKKLISAAKAAISDLSACTALYVGNLDIPDLSYIRREDEANIDPSVPVARFRRKNKDDVLLINWAAHCDTVAGSIPTSVSSDYIGVLRKSIKNSHGIDVAVAMGACGDVNPACFFKDEHPYIGKEEYGKALANAITSQLNNLREVKINGRIQSINRTVGAKVDHSDDELTKQATEIRNLYYSGKTDKYNEKCLEYGIDTIYEATSIVHRAQADLYENVSLRTISVGNIVFAAAPYEMFASNGLRIKSASEFDCTFVMGYSNGTNSYIPSDYAYDVGGYEVYSCLFERGTAELLADAFSDMIGELHHPLACKHEFSVIESDEDYHLLKCSKCEYKLPNPSKHSFDEGYVCYECGEHIHKTGVLKGFSGMTMSCIGSSTTLGSGIEHSYVDKVEELLGLEATYNYGVSWSTLGHKEKCDCNHPYLPEDYNHDPMVYRYEDIHASDIIFVLGGLNDFGMELPLGEPDDETPHTFFGALNLLFTGIKVTYPDSYLFTATNLNYFDGYTNEDGVTWEQYNEAIRIAAKTHGIDCLDLYSIPFNRLTDTHDYVHPTQKYTDSVLAPTIASFIKNNFTRDYYYEGCVRCDEGEKLYYENLFTDTVENHGKICTYDLSTRKFIEKDSSYASYTLIDVDGIEELRFAFTENSPSVAWSYFFYNEDDVCISGANLPTGLTDVYVDVPNGATYIGVLYSPNLPYGVYQAG